MAEQSLEERLITLRDQLTSLLVHADDRTAPALSREYRSVLADLEKLGVKEASSVDDLAARRAARIADTKGSEKAGARKRGSRPGGHPAS